MLTAAKVGVSPTLKGQAVSGTLLGRSSSVTGDEYGACKPVTGSSYIGADQYAEFCANRAVTEVSNRGSRGKNVMVERRQAAAQLVQPDQQPGQAPSESARVMQCGRFSIVSPAQSAQDTTQRITGSAYGGTDRITGSLARATGKVSGTPEFRYREGIEAPVDAVADAKERSPERITGEGRERNVTGDAWDRGDRITGTEGLSAARRNPTWRGEPRINPATKNAREFRKAELPEAQPSRVTGCSGSSMTGAAVTMSGGARG
ncbi:MAG: CsoS2 family carboxysome shell protein [Halothiobacillus sp.]